MFPCALFVCCVIMFCPFAVSALLCYVNVHEYNYNSSSSLYRVPLKMLKHKPNCGVVLRRSGNTPSYHYATLPDTSYGTLLIPWSFPDLPGTQHRLYIIIIIIVIIINWLSSTSNIKLKEPTLRITATWSTITRRCSTKTLYLVRWPCQTKKHDAM